MNNIKKRELENVANELEGLAIHIREYLSGDVTDLPMTWDIQEILIIYKNINKDD